MSFGRALLNKSLFLAGTGLKYYSQYKKASLKLLVHSETKLPSPNCHRLHKHLICTIATPDDKLDEEEQATSSQDTQKDLREASKDRTTVIPVDISICYVQSNAYKETYGDNPVWKLYRRNYKGPFPPHLTRVSCIRKGMITTGNPCPICRDEYLVLHPTNVKLLEQFICPHTGELYPTKKTGLCRRKHREISVAICQARDLGLLKFQVPFRKYDYTEYYPQLKVGMKH